MKVVERMHYSLNVMNLARPKSLLHGFRELVARVEEGYGEFVAGPLPDAWAFVNSRLLL